MNGSFDNREAHDSRSRATNASAPAPAAPRGAGQACLTRRSLAVCGAVALASGVAAALSARTPAFALAEGASGKAAQPASLPSWVDEETAQTLLSLAGDPTVDAIIADAPALGEADQPLAQKLLKLAANDPAARAFVAGFRSSYPGTKAGSLTDDDLADGGVPLLMQWDERWGYMEYIGGPMGTRGCCPTCLAMLYAGYSGRTDMSPYIVSLLASESGLCDPDLGTYGEFVGYFCQHVGMEYAELCDLDAAAAALNDGWSLVCNLGAGEFTEVGHYVLVTDWADYDGNVHVRDPYTSSVNGQPWPLATVFFECNSTYAVRAGTVQALPGT